jgi:hypothetical protein
VAKAPYTTCVPTVSPSGGWWVGFRQLYSKLCALLCAQGTLQVQCGPNKLRAILCQCVCAGAV